MTRPQGSSSTVRRWVPWTLSLVLRWSCSGRSCSPAGPDDAGAGCPAAVLRRSSVDIDRTGSDLIVGPSESGGPGMNRRWRTAREDPHDNEQQQARGWAWLALAALAGLVVVLGALVVHRGTTLLALFGGWALLLVLVSASSWWALTTRRAWKVATGGAVVVAAALATVASLALAAAIGVAEIGAVLALAAGTWVYVIATRRALGGH